MNAWGAERCDCCSEPIGRSGLWVTVDHHIYKFCSHRCMDQYDPQAEHEIVI